MHFSYISFSEEEATAQNFICIRFLSEPNRIFKNRSKKNSQTTLKFSSTSWLRGWCSLKSEALRTIVFREQEYLETPDLRMRGVASTKGGAEETQTVWSCSHPSLNQAPKFPPSRTSFSSLSCLGS